MDSHITLYAFSTRLRQPPSRQDRIVDQLVLVQQSLADSLTVLVGAGMCVQP